jgi:class 3 adenylate cyclase/DNA-binding winged helix-turn-helix (wHTH) protein
LEFRILGPLEVADGDRQLEVRGHRQRALLALLLLNANQVVSSNRLIDELWGETPPESGATALQVRLSQLRKALQGGSTNGALVVTQSPGYVLRIDPERVDAHRFERLVTEARALAADRGPARAAAILREALGLWRGPALADLAHEPFARGEIARLEELRLVALEERLEADLALGHADVVAELEALVGAHPFRERLRAQLMLALYRSGRQADALAVYRDARHALVEELGIEPGQDLRQLEQAILQQDPALAPPGRRRERIDASLPPAPLQTAEERKVVTALFVDLVGSTELVAGDDPERARALLERYFDAIAAEIEEAGGTVEKFIGDAVAAVFGAPVAQEDHAERALHVALAIRRRVGELFGDRVHLRTGIATGEVVVGKPRETGSFVTGMAVNAAARLEQAAAPGEILVSERTVKAAGAAFEFEAPRSVVARGIEGGIPSRTLVRALTLARPRGFGGVAPVFVGRESELELLRATYHRVASGGRPSVVTVLGAAGVGKTRLVREFWDWLASQTPAPRRRVGRCLSYGKGITYRPLGDILREELGLLENDPPERVLERLGDRRILGLVRGLQVAPDLHPLAAREQLHEAWVELLEELAAERPLVILVEDLHWAEEPLLDLLERTVRDVRGPILLVVTARPELIEQRRSWGGQRDGGTIWLEPLGHDDVELLLEELVAELPAELRRLLIEQAEGNPFFLEELLSSLSDQGVLVRTAEGWSARESAVEIRVPDSVQSVLAARIDLLPPAEKAALQAAAVIGRVFWCGPVLELLGDDKPDFAVLDAHDFISCRPASSVGGERECMFKHALTRDVAYAGIPKARRARLHAAFAGWLERACEGRDESAPLLAHHYAEAVRPDDADLAWSDEPEELERLRAKAVRWLRRAGELAVGRYEIDEGIALFERALELESDEDVLCELWRSLGRAHALKYEGEPFWTAMQRAITLTSDGYTLGEVYADLAFETGIRAGMWRVRPEGDYVDGWIESALRFAAPDSRARAKALLALCHWNPAEAHAAAVEASAIAGRLGDPELRSWAWDARGITNFVAGEHDLGRAWEERRFELVDEIVDPEHRADIYYAPITGCVLFGYFREAQRLARRHDEISAILTPHHQMHGIAVLLELQELLGAWDKVSELQDDAVARIAANASTPCVRNARALLVCAAANAQRGHYAEARRLEEAAEDLDMQGFGHILDTPRIRLALARGDLERAERLVAEPMPTRGWHRGWLLLSTQATRLDALAVLGRRDEIEAWPHVRRGTYLEPFALRALGAVREDEGLLRRGLACFEALGLEWHAAETRALLRSASRATEQLLETQTSDRGVDELDGMKGRQRPALAAQV